MRGCGSARLSLQVSARIEGAIRRFDGLRRIALTLIRTTLLVWCILVLILRSLRSKRLEGWAANWVRAATLRDARLRRAPQDEASRRGLAAALGATRVIASGKRSDPESQRRLDGFVAFAPRDDASCLSLHQFRPGYDGGLHRLHRHGVCHRTADALFRKRIDRLHFHPRIFVARAIEHVDAERQVVAGETP